MTSRKKPLKKLNLHEFTSLKTADLLSPNRKQSESLEFIRLTQEWEKIVGLFLSKNSNPLKILGKTLIILTRHSIFSQELSLMSETLKHKIGEEFPKLKNKIDSIKYQVTPQFFEIKNTQIIEEQKSEAKKSQKFHAFSPTNRALKEKINQEFSEINDPELKELLASLFLQNFHNKNGEN
ncbi:MAG: DUF721 domain-containing protein [Bacteriovoracaceae bacterium]